MRSLREIAFRMRQELWNAWSHVFPPDLAAGGAQAAGNILPGPRLAAKRVAGTSFAQQLIRDADDLLAHRFRLLAHVVETGPAIDWRRDYVHGRSSGLEYFRFVPYLDFARVGDHKVIWELNRHQHLVLLSQAFCLTGQPAYRDEVWRQLETWWQQNPFGRGINWASALEVAFRALSWIWIFHLTGAEMPEEFRTRFLAELYRHGRHLEHNLSFYFSPNTHLLGEAVALHALGAMFPQMPRSARWRELGAETVRRQLDFQVQPDGSHFEQSSFYHVYALDMLLFHATLTGCESAYTAKLTAMANYLDALLGPERVLPLLGDDDGGRFFHPYGRRREFGRATMATCCQLLPSHGWHFEPCDLWPQAAWWLHDLPADPPAFRARSVRFANSGLVCMTHRDRQVIVDTGPFGWGGAGHSHSDTLSVVIRAGHEEILIDPGTFTYVSDPVLRERFRGTAAHNTIQINGRDQAEPAGPFAWRRLPQVICRTWESNPKRDTVEAECIYGGFRHIRSVIFVKPDIVLIFDEVIGPGGEYEVSQFWHLDSERATGRLALDGPAETIPGWRSNNFGEMQPAPVVRATKFGPLPCRFSAAVALGDGALTISPDGGFLWNGHPIPS